MNDIELKRCTKCGEIKTLDCFHKHKGGKDGLCAACKVCRNEQGRRWQQANPERRNENARRWYWANPERSKESSRRWRRANPEWHKENSRRRREINPEYERQWRKANPEKNRIKVNRRHARKLSLPDTLTHSQWHTCLEYFNHCCAFCGKQRDFWHTIEAEHYIPLSSPDCPGTTALNIVPSCRSCNASKSNTSVDVWLQRKFPKTWREILARIEAYFKWVQEQESD